MLDESGTARISQTSTSLVSQTFSVPQRRSLLVCGTQREGSILKAIDAAGRKGSGLRDYHRVGCNTVEFSYTGSSLVPTPRAPSGEKRSGERSRISWAYSPKR